MSISDNKDSRVQPERAEPPDILDRVRAIEESVEREGSSTRFWSAKNVPSIVSVVAAVVSVVVAAYSTLHGMTQERHNKRIELTAMLEKLVALQENPNDQYVVLGKLAPRLVDELSSDVSGPEYSIVARAVLASGNTPLAIDYAQKAVRKAENVNDKTLALRQLGWTLAQSGKIDDGYKTYLMALAVVRQENLDEQQAWVKADQAFTYADWAQIAAIMGRCEASRAAKKEMADLMPSVRFRDDRKALNIKLAQLNSDLDEACPQKMTK